jgi:hypothetical protein
MRRNRKLTRRYSSLYGYTACVAGFLMTLLVTMMVYYFVDSKCNQLSQSIGREKNRLAQLEKERKRESARWEQMKTRTGLDEALRRHGLAMTLARPDQIVRIDAAGKVVPGQISVAKIKQNRAAAERVAANNAKRAANASRRR